MGWVFYGALLGLLTQAFSDLAEHIFGPEAAGVGLVEQQRKRIVILGGGFAGMKTAEYLERELHTNSSAMVTLISETNALLFTPMLAEVAGSTLEPSHISTPLRSSLHRTEFIRGRVNAIDLENREVVLASDSPTGQLVVPYDHLVLALGSVSNYLGMANVEKLAFNFKSLLDAICIRNRVIEMFERADRESDASQRGRFLSFVIAGGGFAGGELAGALNDFARGILADYPNLNPNELKIVLVHSRDRILPELSESLARYAQKKMEARGVSFRLNARLSDVQPGVVMVSDEEIRAQTLVWTAGTAPNPLLKSQPFERDKRGAVKVDPTLAVPGHSGLWALGDCAAVNDSKSGKPCPPTAQFAIREAATVARNIAAQLGGRPLKAFHFDSLGALCVVGHQTACAELKPAFCPEQIRALLRAAGVADVAGNLSFEIAGKGEEDSCPDRLGDRAFLPTRHRADDRFARGAPLNVSITTLIDCDAWGINQGWSLASAAAWAFDRHTGQHHSKQNTLGSDDSLHLGRRNFWPRLRSLLRQTHQHSGSGPDLGPRQRVASLVRHAYWN